MGMSCNKEIHKEINEEIVDLNKNNIMNIFDKTERSFPFKLIQQSDDFPTYEIEQKRIEVKNNGYQVFKVTKTIPSHILELDMNQLVAVVLEKSMKVLML